MKTTSEWLTIDELAIRWNLSRSAIYNMVSRRDSQLPRFMRISGRLRFALSDVIAREEQAVQEAMGGRQ